MFVPTKRESLLEVPGPRGRRLQRSKSVQLRPRSKSSKFRHGIIRAQMKLRSTKQSLEPTEIKDSKARLKCTKQITTNIFQIVNNLYWAQIEQARLVGTLSNQLSNIKIQNEGDKFAIFLNNMGRVQQNLKEIDEMYFMNMKDELVDPLKLFNLTQIKKCQDTKIQLKTIKGEYDLMKNKDDNKPSKLNELQSVREEFISHVNTMELSKSSLLESMQQYMESYKAYALMHSTNIHQQHQMMLLVPPEPSNISDTEDCFMNDFDEVQSTCNDWAKTSLIVKQGAFKKRGKFNKGLKKRWFKLFVNKKLTYFELNTQQNGPNGMLKGHANLSNIITINTKKRNLIEIQTSNRTWVFQYDNTEDRDDWYHILNQTCIKQQRLKSIAQTAYEFGTIFKQKPQRMDSMYKNIDSVVQCRFNYPSKVSSCSIFNDGYTVQVNIPYETNPCLLYIRNQCYILRAFNFHTPSEHTIDTKRYEMELHLLHTNALNSNDVAVMAFIFTPRIKYKKGKLAYSKSGHHMVLKKVRRKKHTVVIVPEFTDDDDDDTESEDDETDVDMEWDLDEKYDAQNENDFLKQFWDELPLRETKQDRLLSTSLSFEDLLTTSSDTFVQNIETNEVRMDLPLLEYIGPLTTPPYTEGVKWFVSKTRHYIGRQQLNKLSLCWGQL